MINIKKIISELPELPGIYIYKDENGQVIYVGKAKKLKRRVSQYFVPTERLTIKTANLVKNIRDLEYIVTDSEEEALILECNFIKRYRPRYNILLKDDKTYPYIKVTKREKYPRVIYTRYYERDGSKYFGPYPDSDFAKRIIDILHSVYKIRKCNKRDFVNQGRPCINYDIKLCSGPCCNNISEEEYNERIDKIIKFLDGNNKEVIGILEKKMQELAERYQFEEAAKLRDDIGYVKRIVDEQKITSMEVRNQDIITVQKSKSGEFALVHVMNIIDGRMQDRKQIIIDDIENESNESILTAFIKQYYIESYNIPNEIMIENDIEELEDIENVLTKMKKTKVKIIVPKIGKNKRLVILARENSKIAIEQYEKKSYERNDVKSKISKELKELLNLTNNIRRIESYDISNIQGVDNVGAMVVFINGEKSPKDYRKFKIKTVEGSNDVGSMKEVLTRRLKRYLDNDSKFNELPDLILMDGGENQVNIANKVVCDLGLSIPIAGLVKDDNHRTNAIYYDGKKIEIDKRGDLFLFLTRVQDEVHNSAISYFKSLHNKNMIKSELDNIEGVGEVRKLALLKKFKSVRNIKDASIEDIMQVKGMNRRTAENIKNYLEALGG